MNKAALKYALCRGIPSGIVTWLIYGLVFEMLIDKAPFKEALFGRSSLVFGVICIIVECVISYVSRVRKAKQQ